MKKIGLLPLLISFYSQASLVDFGSAEHFLMAAGGHNSIMLGSAAHLMGSVAAGYYISAGSGVIIEGDACAPALGIGAGVRIDGVQQCSAPTLQSDILAGSAQLASLLAQPAFDVTHSTTLQAGIYQLGALLLSAGNTLTLHGSATDIVVINVSGPAQLGSGAAIALTGGLKASNVYFNFIRSAQYHSFEFGGATLLGTFVSDGRSFIMGDGATLENTRFFTNGSIVANVQTVSYRPDAQIPLPPGDDTEIVAPVPVHTLSLLTLLAGLWVGWRTIRRTPSAAKMD